MARSALDALSSAVVLGLLVPVGAQQPAAPRGDEVPYVHPRPVIAGWTPADAYGLSHRDGGIPPYRFRVVRDPADVEFGSTFRAKAIDIGIAFRMAYEGCWYPHRFAFEPAVWGVEPVETLEALVANSAAIAHGVVTGIEGGVLHLGGPGLMLQVEVSTWLEQAAAQPPVDVVHVFYPRGTFYIDGVRICATAVYDFPPPPDQGAEILLFPESLGRDPAVPDRMAVSGMRMAFQTGTGAAATPELLRVPEFRGTSFQDMLRAAREAIREAR